MCSKVWWVCENFKGSMAVDGRNRAKIVGNMYVIK
jgi:hypothetical protein